MDIRIRIGMQFLPKPLAIFFVLQYFLLSNAWVLYSYPRLKTTPTTPGRLGDHLIQRDGPVSMDSEELADENRTEVNISV